LFSYDLFKKQLWRIPKQKIIFICVPAGKTVDKIISGLSKYLSKGDIIIDLGNSFYKDSQRRATNLLKKEIHFIDVGMSGGIDGAKNGACLMIGGNKNVFSKIENLFQVISNGSYQYIGKSGAGHLVKGYHNLIEYGYLQALAEGLDSLNMISENEKMNINLKNVCDIWSKGSIIESRLVNDAKIAFNKNKSFKEYGGSVFGQTLEEMKKLIKIANTSGVKIYSCKAAVDARLSSQKNPTNTGKIINAIRNVFGGHVDWKK